MLNCERRILYTHRTQMQGAEGAHVRGMVEGFRALGWQVDVVGPPGVPYSPEIKKEGNGMKSSVLRQGLSLFAKHAPQPAFEMVEMIYNLPARKRLKIMHSRKPYNFIYERYSLNTLAASWLAQATQMPMVLEVNDATVIERSRPLYFHSLARRNEKKIFEKASLLITISNYFKKLIVNEFQIADDKVLVLPNAIDPDRFDLSKKKRLARTAFGIPEQAIVLGCMGAFLPWHGLDFLIKTMADDAEHDNLFFLFIGDGPVREQVTNLARLSGISERVLFTGFLPPDDIPCYLDLADICVLPDSNDHGSPMKIFEYMAVGKPVVLPAYQPMLDTIEPGVEGLFFDAHDGDGLKSALKTLIQSQEVRLQLGEKGKKKVYEKHIWTQHARRVLEKLPCVTHD